MQRPEPATTFTNKRDSSRGATVSAGRPRRRRKRKVTARFYRMTFSIVALVVLVSYGAAFWRIAQVERRIVRVRRDLAAIEMRNEQLRDELDYVSSDEYVESVAREDLGLVRDGETAFVVVKPNDPDDPFHVGRRQDNGLTDREGW